MKKPARIGIQVVAWTALGLVVAAFADGPRFDPLPAGHGRLTLAVAHLSERREPCRQLSEAERQALPPTRRVSEVCERARSPVDIELTVNGQPLVRQTFKPSGLHEDGRIYSMKRWSLPAGDHDLALTMRPHSDAALRRARFALSLAGRTSAVIDVEDHDIRLLNTEPETQRHAPGENFPGKVLSGEIFPAPQAFKESGP